MKASRSETLDLPGRRLHVRRWGDPAAPTLFLLHGWMDVSASFQFVVDALAREWNIVAPDWRGFGPSQWLGRPYYFSDHVADCAALVDHYSLAAPARLVGHSMGGIIACLYAGIRPERVERLISIEGFGIAPTTPDMAPERYRQWLDAQITPPRMHTYRDRAAFASRLARDNPRLTPERATFLAEHLAVPVDGGVAWAGDPWHKAPGAYLFRLEESMAIWREITAPTLWIAAPGSTIVREFNKRPGDWAARQACFRNVRETWVDDAGHMLHHDQPETIACLIEDFLTATPPNAEAP